MNNGKWSIIFGKDNDWKNKENITKECFRVAKNANFPMDLMDVSEHLFANKTCKRIYVMSNENKIMGFAVYDVLNNLDTVHIHGIIIDKFAQGYGLSKIIIEEILKKEKCLYLTAKTHNPRVYELLSKFAKTKLDIYPNTINNFIPQEIYYLVKKNKYLFNVDLMLIVRNAYNDEKVIQKCRDEKIKEIFSELNIRDAQAIIVRII